MALQSIGGGASLAPPFNSQSNTTERANDGVPTRSDDCLSRETLVSKNQENVARTSGRYKLLGRSEIFALPKMAWRVKQLLPQVGLAAIFGPSGAGKSFLAIDLAMAIAGGEPWFGCKTSKCPVTYVMLEGEGGLWGRINAWEHENGQPIPAEFNAVIEPFQLIDPIAVQNLAETVLPGGVIFIDTLNRATPTTDENSSQDMGLVLKSVKRLQSLTESLVVFVHHTGKDTSRGMRGHSSLTAALDGAIEVERTKAGCAWRAAKVKDGDDGQYFSFSLNHHVLGQDSDGEDITSCAIGPGAVSTTERRFKPPSGKQQQAALVALHRCISASNIMDKCDSAGKPCLKIEDGIAAVVSVLATLPSNKRTNRARALLLGLQLSQHLTSGIDPDGLEWLWLP